jgi:hypothetical protein
MQSENAMTNWKKKGKRKKVCMKPLKYCVLTRNNRTRNCVDSSRKIGSKRRNSRKSRNEISNKGTTLIRTLKTPVTQTMIVQMMMNQKDQNHAVIKPTERITKPPITMDHPTSNFPLHQSSMAATQESTIGSLKLIDMYPSTK